MRKQFADWAMEEFAKNPRAVFLTGDLGYKALEGVSLAMGERFVNVGVAEQNMISMAAACAHEGLVPICYSIAPFVVFRPAEQIRLDVCLHNKNVKLVGNGGGYGYGMMSATHHALEDIAVLSCLPNMRCYVPVCDDDVVSVCRAMTTYDGPSYLRLGLGQMPAGVSLPSDYEANRQLQQGDEVTIVGMGPALLNVWDASLRSKVSADIFCISELPLVSAAKILESLNRTGKLLVVEEHVERGGLAENLLRVLAGHTQRFSFVHRYAVGYPDGLSGSQAYHQKKSGLDVDSLINDLKRMAAQ